LNVQTLANQSPDQSFLQIADAVDSLANPVDKANALMTIFGKTGINMSAVVAGGSEALKAMSADAEKLGLSFSRVDAAKVELANDAISRMWKLFEGVGNTLAIQLAPYIEAAANKLTDMGIAGLNSGNVVVGAVEWIAMAIAKTADFLELFKAGWYGLKAGVLFAALGAVKAIDFLGESIVKLMNLLPGVELEWTDTFSTLADAITEDGIKAAEAFNAAIDRFSAGENSQKVKTFFDDVKKQSAEAAEQIAKDAESKAGMGSQLAAAFDAKKEEEEKAKERDKAAKKAAEDRQKHEEDLQKKIQDMDPLLAFGKKKAELDELLAAGLSKNVFDKELSKAVDEFQSASETDDKGSHALIGSRSLVGADYFAGNSQQSDSATLKQILEQLKVANQGKGIGVLSEYQYN